MERCLWERTHLVLNLRSLTHVSVCLYKSASLSPFPHPGHERDALLLTGLGECKTSRATLGQTLHPGSQSPGFAAALPADAECGKELGAAVSLGSCLHQRLEREVCGASRWRFKSGNTVYLNWQWFTTHLHRLPRVQPFAKGRELVGGVVGCGAWGCEHRTFHPREYKHSIVCDLKRLGREHHWSLLSVVWTALGLPKEAPRQLPALCLRAVTGQSQLCWTLRGTPGSCLCEACHCASLGKWFYLLQRETCQLPVRPREGICWIPRGLFQTCTVT